MFVSFLLPHIDRGAGPLFHWAMLAQMASFGPDQVAFIGDEACFEEDSVPFGEVLSIAGIQFKVPERDVFRAFSKTVLDPVPVRRLVEARRTYLGAFATLLTEPDIELIQALDDCLDRDFAGMDIEAFLTWCNCPSLAQVAAERGIPVIHNEMGPLRSPRYANTFYFDFNGVNGGSTPALWRSEADLRDSMRGAALIDEDRLRGRLLRDLSVPDGSEGRSDRVGCGVALQVEDDSNAVAFSNGWDCVHVISLALTRHGIDQTVIRDHPGARFAYKGGLGEPDRSEDAVAFLARIGRLYSINSSLLAEAMFWGVPFEALGQTPVERFSQGAELSELLHRDRALCLNAFFIGYLMPAALLFDPDYYRWRLAAPRTLAECHERHLPYYSEAEPVPPLQGNDGESVPAARGMTRAEWTASLAVLRSNRRLHRELEDAVRMRAEVGAELARLSEASGRQLQASAQALRDKQIEAETVWEEMQWFKQRTAELEAELLRCDGESAALRASLVEQQNKASQLELALAQAERERAALASDNTTLLAQIDVLRERGIRYLRRLKDVAKRRLTWRERRQGRLELDEAYLEDEQDNEPQA